jgi:hypothetical protein
MEKEEFMLKSLPHFFDARGGLVPMAIELSDVLKLPRFFTAEAFVECLQENFLRPSQTERYQCSLPVAAQAMARSDFRDWCQRWGYLTETYPKKNEKSYDAIVIYALGVEGMYRVRKYLQKIFVDLQEKVLSSFPKIFILTGSRPLTMEGEKSMAQCLRERNLPETEEWAARILFRNFLETTGWTWEIVNVAMRQERDAAEVQWIRPNTRDTLHAFFQKCGSIASLLAMSIHPFVSYQHMVGMATWMECEGRDVFSSKTLETVGPLHPRFVPSRWAQDEDRLVAILLENFARWAYEEGGVLRVKGSVL